MPKEDTQFKPGNPGRKGIPTKKGGAERLETAVDAILERVLEKALGGDLQAADILMRFYVRKDLAR
jgi:hypothetical protein